MNNKLAEQKYKETVGIIWEDILWGQSSNQKLEIVDDILTEFLKKSSQSDREELESLLWRWNARIKFTEALIEANEEE